jgi:type IV pilus assembly protein PilW
MNNWVKVKWVPFLNAAPDASNRLLNKGDFVVLAQPDGTSYRCLRLKITAIQRSAAFPDSQYLQMKFDPGNKPPDGQPENPPDTVNDFFPPGGGGYIPSAGSYVKPMGRALNWVRYSVDSATMQLVSQASGEAATPVAEGVVSLQVQYGVGAKDNDVVDGVTCTKGWAQPACQRVIRWVTATNGAGFDGVNWGNLVNEADVRRIKAVRVAIVVRSENLERDTNPLAATPGLYGVAGSGKPIIVVPGACAAAGQVTDLAGRMCVWEDGVNAVDGSTAAAPQVDLSKRPDGATAMPDWDRYRYKVYETTVPMRNVMWSTKGS